MLVDEPPLPSITIGVLGLSRQWRFNGYGHVGLPACISVRHGPSSIDVRWPVGGDRGVVDTDRSIARPFLSRAYDAVMGVDVVPVRLYLRQVPSSIFI